MRKLTCPCEQVFNVDIPETVNLDTSVEIIESIKNGSFLTCICPTCNAVLHTDLQTRFDWPSKGTSILLIPEVERYAYLSGKIDTGPTDIQVTIGFAELADRICVIEKGLDPLIIETIKYHLAVKSREVSPDAQLKVCFERLNESNDLEFHLHGLKTDEVAVMNIPAQVYKTIEKDLMTNPEKEPYTSLKQRSYVSVNNILIEDATHE